MTTFPLLSVVISPRTAGDRDKLSRGLAALAAEDTAMRATILESGDAVVGGMGEIHLDVIAERVIREFEIAATVSGPKVIYKETMTQAADGEGRYIKQRGGGGEYAHAKIHLQPGRLGSGYVFVNEIVGAAIPQDFISSIDDGIRDALAQGVLAGYPVDDVRIVLYDGSYHDVDSSAASFRIAGAMAFADAAKHAKPILLEPVMHVEVATPSTHVQEEIAQLTTRYGRDLDAATRSTLGDGRGVISLISAVAPMSKLLGYANDLRQRTNGRGRCTLTLRGYEPVSPDDVAGAAAGVRLRPSPSPLHSGIALTEPDDARPRSSTNT